MSFEEYVTPYGTSGTDLTLTYFMRHLTSGTDLTLTFPTIHDMRDVLLSTIERPLNNLPLMSGDKYIRPIFASAATATTAARAASSARTTTPSPWWPRPATAAEGKSQHARVFTLALVNGNIFCPIQVLGVRGHVRGVAGPLPLGERQVRRRQVQVSVYRVVWL